MIVIFDLNNNSNKKVFYLFTSIFGFSKTKSQIISAQLGVDPNYKVRNLSNNF
jgi:ribosomal protein S13